MIWNETTGLDIKVFFRCLMPFTLVNRWVGKEFHLDQISGAPMRIWFKDPSEQMQSHKHEKFSFIPLATYGIYVLIGNTRQYCIILSCSSSFSITPREIIWQNMSTTFSSFARSVNVLFVI